MGPRALLSLAVFSASAFAHAGNTHVIVIDAMEFRPGTLEVRVGDRVTWTNKDPFPHTVASKGKGFRSPEIASGKSWTMVARRQGDFAYICTLHPTMKARLIVK